MGLPGTRLLAIARLWFDESSIRDVFEPLVADWQREYVEAPTRRARQAHYWCGAASFAITLSRCAPRVLLRLHSGRDFRTALAAIAGFSLLGVALNVLLWDWPSNLTRYPSASWPFLAPAFIVGSAPYAMLPLALLIRARARDRRHARVLVTQLTIAQLAFIVLFGGWLVPKSNQEYRTIVAASFNRSTQAAGTDRAVPATRDAALNALSRRDRVGDGPARGVNELTTWELFISNAWPPDVHAPRNEVVAGRHARIVLMCLPLVLATLGWGLGSLSHRAARVRALMWWAFACAVVVVFRSGTITFQQTYGWPPGLVDWLPVMLFLAAALAARPGCRTPDTQAT
jgi:hypothetical protein